MTTFRDKGPYNAGGFPTIPHDLGRMVGASGPGDDAGGHDAARLLTTILANAANIGAQELQELQDAGANNPNPTFDPAKTAAAAFVTHGDHGHIQRPAERLESEDDRIARKARQSMPRAAAL